MIIPTIFAHNKQEFQQRFSKLITISKNLQIDFMDGKFVHAKSIQLKDLPNLCLFKNNFEAHLMVQNPDKYLKSLKQKGFKKIIFHIEATKYPEKTIEKIKALNLEAWPAINPETPLTKVLPFVNEIQGILFMGVHPGKEHQKFIPTAYKKIKTLRSRYSKLKIQVDGGANEKVIKKLSKLGVDYVNSGSYISDAENPREVLKELSELFSRK